MGDEKVDFTINSVPKDITFECPHCEYRVDVPFGEVDEPRSWMDDWGSVECPDCGKEVRLGNFEYC